MAPILRYPADPKSLLQRVNMRSLEDTLRSFLSSKEGFRIVRSHGAALNGRASKLRTLLILDSSFNPPSKAHLFLATSAVTRLRDNLLHPLPHRLLLLFSTHNADKVAQIDTFAERLAMINLFAEDVISALQAEDPQSVEGLGVDVGLTSSPYYTDKSSAIAATDVYPKDIKHVHIIGYDTFTRIVNPKYYPGHNPPFSALAPYFEAGHHFLFTQRPAVSEDESSESWGSTEDQQKFLDDLKIGSLEELGFQKTWGEQVHMLPPGNGQGISSTRLRAAVSKGNWDEADKLCTPSVLEWIKSRDLYRK